MIRFIDCRISSCENRSTGAAAASSTMMRTSTAVAPSGVARIGFRSTSANCGKSLTRSDTALITLAIADLSTGRSEEHTSELQSRGHLVCRLLLEKKKYIQYNDL